MAAADIHRVIERNEFYRDNYRRVLSIFVLSVLINIVLVGVLSFMITHPPAPRYFATSINGRITPLYPLNKPNQSDSAILQWANQAAIAAYSYNYVTYRRELQAASEFFTREGWRDFTKELKGTNNLDAVISKKLIVSAVATQAPVILEKGILGGGYSWRVQMPLLVTYQSPSEFSQEKFVVTLLVQRVSSLNSARGIGIAQFIASRSAA